MIILEMIKLFFTTSPKDCEKLELLKSNILPPSNYSALCWCGKIIYRYEDRINEETINHESIHLAQAKVEGSWFKYYAKYLWQWFKKRDYYLIPYECEAYAKEDKGPEAWRDYDGSELWTKYDFKERVPGWKKYLKSL